MYAFGHAAVVASLGILALAFGAVLPDWFDAIMGRIVGITLVVLGTWVLASVILFARKGGQFQWRSRWMLVFIGASQLWSYLRRDPTASTRHAVRTYAPIGAFAVGAIHGIGAETATQVVVISGVAGTGGDAPTGMAMLAAFILGMLASNTAVIVMLAIGFAWGRAARRLTIAAGLATGALSVVVGSAFLLGLDLDSVFAIAAV
jgi:high-affinity nickel-transport protein